MGSPELERSRTCPRSRPPRDWLSFLCRAGIAGSQYLGLVEIDPEQCRRSEADDEDRPPELEDCVALVGRVRRLRRHQRRAERRSLRRLVQANRRPLSAELLGSRLWCHKSWSDKARQAPQRADAQHRRQQLRHCLARKNREELAESDGQYALQL